MFNRKTVAMLAVSLFITGLASCGSGDVQVQPGGAGNSTAQLVDISITPADPSIAKNTNQQFIATGIYSDNTSRDLTDTVTWSSSDADVAEIGSAGGVFSDSTTQNQAASTTMYSRGRVNCRGTGKTTIKANYSDISGSTTLTVTDATLVSISVTPANTSLVKGTSQQFIATGTFSDNTTQDLTTAVAWNSSTAAIATISNTAGSNGLAASAAAGSTTITATSGSISGSTTLTVTPATLLSLAVTPTNPSIAKNTAQQFIATGTFSDNTTQDLTTAVAWNSSAEAVATISNAAGSKGMAASAAAGSTTITATSGSIAGAATLTVTPATLLSIAVTPTNPSVAKGTAQQFIATGTYSDNTTQNLTTAVTWNSSNTGAATISNAAGSKGLATSAATGSTTVTAASGGISGSTTLTVTPATLVSIAITPINPSIAAGTTQQFTATGTYSDNTAQNLTTAVTWNSSNTGAATVSNAAGSKGLATSAATGPTTVTATSGGISGSTTLTVTPATLVSIAVTPANPSIAKGTTRQFTATGTYSNNTTQNLTATVTWSSSAAAVATISNADGSRGLAASAATGSTTIRATLGSISGSAMLTVTPATLVSMTITPVSASLTAGATQQFSATGTYSDNTTQNLTTTATWSSSNTGIASISNAAGSNGLAVSASAGTATITVISGSISASTTLMVTGIPAGTTLAWDAPVSPTDGSPVTGLAGYRIHFGTASGTYTGSVDVGNVTSVSTSAVSAAVPAPGVYFLVVTAYDSDGNESAYSNEISRTF